jgi:hypothetical protein
MKAHANTSQKIANKETKVSKLFWKNWNVGGKLIFLSTCAAIASMFGKWADIGFTSRSGFSENMYLLLIFYIYPIIVLFENRKIKIVWGLLCSIASLALNLAYLNYNQIVFLNKRIITSAGGAWLFFIASAALTVGVVVYSFQKRD